MQENECHIELPRLKIGQEKQEESGEESIKEFIDPLDDNLLDIDSSRIEENTNENVQKQTEGMKDSDTSPLFNENTKDEEKSTKECHHEETIDVLGGGRCRTTYGNSHKCSKKDSLEIAIWK